MKLKIPNEKFDLEMSTGRLEAFSDGVFAIAITLLILEIKIPKHDDIVQAGGLNTYLFNLWPSYFAYVLSFSIIGIYWANHNYIFKLVDRTNHIFNMMNIAFLMCISFLPFPTAILGNFITDPEHRQGAVSLYSLGMFLPALLSLIKWKYASDGHKLVNRNLKQSYMLFMTRLLYLSNVLYVFALVSSFFCPIVSLTIIVMLTLVYLFPPKKPEFGTVDGSS